MKKPNRDRVNSILKHLGYEAPNFGWDRYSIQLTRLYYEDEQFQTAIDTIANIIDEVPCDVRSKA